MIIFQIGGKWQACDTKLIPYQRCVSCLILKFRNVTFPYLPQADNQFTDALATLDNMVKLEEGDEMQEWHIEVSNLPAYCMIIEECMNVKVEINGKSWYHNIKAYMKDGEYLSGVIGSENIFIRPVVCQFFFSGEVLYKRNRNKTLL